MKSVRALRYTENAFDWLTRSVEGRHEMETEMKTSTVIAAPSCSPPSYPDSQLRQGRGWQTTHAGPLHRPGLTCHMDSRSGRQRAQQAECP